jgi:hypothetical protein
VPSPLRRPGAAAPVGDAEAELMPDPEAEADPEAGADVVAGDEVATALEDAEMGVSPAGIDISPVTEVTREIRPVVASGKLIAAEFVRCGTRKRLEHNTLGLKGITYSAEARAGSLALMSGQ